MTDTEITALAREYAEERASIMQGSLTTKIQAELVIRFLLRRFCLVEKSKVEEEYRVAKECLDKVPALSIIGSVINGQIITLKSLFPEIAKEVKP